MRKFHETFFCTLSGEISLKSKKVRQRFVETLKKNLVASAEKLGINYFSLKTGPGTLIIHSSDATKTKMILSHCFGIYKYAKVLSETYTDEKEIVEKSLNYFLKVLPENTNYFAVRTKKHELKSFSSMQLNREIGARIVELTSLKVDLSNPDIELFVHVFKKSFFVHTKWFFGLAGLPLGIEGKCVLLVKNLRESIITAFILMRRGTKVFPVMSKKSNLKEKSFNSVLSKYNNFSGFKFYLLEDINFLQQKGAKLIAVPRIDDTPKKLKALNVLPVLNGLPQNILDDFWEKLMYDYNNFF